MDFPCLISRQASAKAERKRLPSLFFAVNHINLYSLQNFFVTVIQHLSTGSPLWNLDLALGNQTMQTLERIEDSSSV